MSVVCTVYLLFGTRLKAGVEYTDIPERLIEGRKDEVLVIYDGMCGVDSFIGHVITSYNSYREEFHPLVIDLNTLQSYRDKLAQDETFHEFSDGSVPSLIFLPHYS